MNWILLLIFGPKRVCRSLAWIAIEHAVPVVYSAVLQPVNSLTHYRDIPDMTTQEISTRLKSLSDSNRDISQLISKLSKLSSSSEAGIDESEVRVELSSEIHQSLKELEEDFELVRQEAEEVANSASWSSGARRKEGEKERDRVNIITQTERLKEDLKL